MQKLHSFCTGAARFRLVPNWLLGQSLVQRQSAMCEAHVALGVKWRRTRPLRRARRVRAPWGLRPGLSHGDATVTAGPTHVSELTGLGWRNGGEGSRSAGAGRRGAPLAHHTFTRRLAWLAQAALRFFLIPLPADHRGYTPIRKSTAEAQRAPRTFNKPGVRGVSAVISVFLRSQGQLLCQNSAALGAKPSSRQTHPIARPAAAFLSPRIFHCAVFFQRDFAHSRMTSFGGLATLPKPS